MPHYNRELIKAKIEDHNYSAWDLAERVIELEVEMENLNDRLSEKEDVISELNDTIDELNNKE